MDSIRKAHGYKLISILLVVLWFLFSLLRMGLNGIRVFSEDLAWLPLSEKEKMARQYTDGYFLSEFIQEKSKNTSRILLISDNGYYYYLSRYLLYPKRIYWATTSDLARTDLSSYSLIILYPQKNLPQLEEKIHTKRASFQLHHNVRFSGYVYSLR